jgi:hypothetical protein
MSGLRNGPYRWSDYLPDEVDDVFMLVRSGKLTPDEAEAWASERNRPPFAASPDIARFDPMSEPDWTLAMGAAWLIWRTPEKVREHWDAYLLECKV